MREPNEMTDAELKFASALKLLPPAAARVDPVSAAFAAGRRAGQRKTRLWQSVSLCLVLAAVGFWLMTPRQGRIAALPPDGGTLAAVQQTPTAPEPLPEQSLLMLQEDMREKGIDGLPADTLPAAQTLRADGFNSL